VDADVLVKVLVEVPKKVVKKPNVLRVNVWVVNEAKLIAEDVNNF
jgi:hypothetical protein